MLLFDIFTQNEFKSTLLLLLLLLLFHVMQYIRAAKWKYEICCGIKKKFDVKTMELNWDTDKWIRMLQAKCRFISSLINSFVHEQPTWYGITMEDFASKIEKCCHCKCSLASKCFKIFIHFYHFCQFSCHFSNKSEHKEIMRWINCWNFHISLRSI